MNKRILKRRYKELYLDIQNYKGHNCGHKMMMTVSSEYYNLVRSFNETADELSKIDKDCPKFRFEIN